MAIDTSLREILAETALQPLFRFANGAGQFAEKFRCARAINHAMVARKRHGHHRSDAGLSIHGHHGVRNRAHGQNRALRRRDDRAKRIHFLLPSVPKVKFPPLVSAGRNRPALARSVNSRRKTESAAMGSLFAFGITAPTTPSFTAIATLILMSGFGRILSPVQLEFIRGCFSSTRASSPISRSVIVGAVPAALPWLNFFCASISAPASTLCTRKKCGTLVQLCVVRSAISRANWLSGSCASATEAEVAGATAPAPLAFAAACTSSDVIVPSGPVP